MNKIEKMIKEMCPNGVEYKTIESVTNYEQPGPYIVKDTNYKEEYDIPVLTAGQTFILGYTNEKNGIYNASIEKPVIIFDDFTTANKWVDFNFKVKSSAMKIITSKDEAILSIRFLYHLIQNIKYAPENHERQWIAKYSQFKIPVPPIEIQNEIVRILDNFTSLTAELTAELIARNKQYEYYRDKLLLTDERNNENITLFLNEVYDFKYGKGNNIPTDGGEYPVYGGNGICGWHSEYNSEDSPVIGHIGAYAGLVQWASGKHFVTYNGIICKHKNDVIIKKLAYYLLTTINLLAEQKGPQPFVSYENLNKHKITFPKDKRIQERIVYTLDNFESICKDLNIGLPAEIEARKKQYEYYRDSLLKFAETGNVEFVERERERERERGSSL